MTINRAEQRPEDKLVRDIQGIKRFQHELKANPQYIGGDVLRVEPVPFGSYILGSTSIGAGSGITFNLTITPVLETLTLWNFLFDVYVDTNDPAYQYPAGTSLSVGQRNMRHEAWISFGDSSDLTNVRVFKIRVTNLDTVSHTYYVRVRAYIPKLTGST